jgi:hypothetical protein
MKIRMYDLLTQAVVYYHGCRQKEKSKEEIERLMSLLREDVCQNCIITFLFDDSSLCRLKFRVNYHHIECEEEGVDCWTDHVVTVDPLGPPGLGFDIGISGSNINRIKDYLRSKFHEALNRKIDD